MVITVLHFSKLSTEIYVMSLIQAWNLAEAHLSITVMMVETYTAEWLNSFILAETDSFLKAQIL